MAMTPISKLRQEAEELLALRKAATEGPWVADDFAMRDGMNVRVGCTGRKEPYYHASATICECWDNTDPENGEHFISEKKAEDNAAFIASAHRLADWVQAALPLLENVEGWRPIAEYDVGKNKHCVFLFQAEGIPGRGRLTLSAHVGTERFYGQRTCTHFFEFPQPPTSGKGE